MAGYIGNQAQIRSGLSATIDELNIIDGVTATTAELNILDGVTSTATELNILDGVTATTAELNIMDGVTATTAELNIMDGVTATAAELNLIDGGTARGTTAVADGDGFLTNDGGTMRMTKVDTLATYMGTKITGGSMVYLASSGAISDGTASVAFTQFDSSKYDAYAFYYYYVIPVTDNVYFVWNSSTDGGSNYAESNGDYRYGQSGAGGNVAYGYVNASYQVGSGTNEFGITGAINLMHPHNTTTYKYFQSSSGPTYGKTNGEIATDANDYGNSYRISTADIDAIRFKFTSGNIESGEIVMYGIKNS